jgi:hypothetical protein
MMLRVRSRLRFFALLLPLCGLPGCIKSEAPLVEASKAVFPFTSLKLEDSDGQKITVKRDGDVYLYSEEVAPLAVPHKPTPVLLYPVEDNLYVAQAVNEAGGVEYVFAKRNGETIVFLSLCEGIDPDILKNLNIERHGADGQPFVECDVKDLKSLVALGQLSNIWTKDTVTVKILSIE